MTGEVFDQDRRTLRRLFPGLRLVGTIRMAFDLRKLVIAALGLALLQLGWSILDRVFPGSSAITPNNLTAGLPIDFDFRAETWTSAGLWQAHERLTQPFRNLLSPLLALFDPRSGWPAMLHALLAISWLFVVWGICGGAICRIAAIRVARMQQTGLAEAIGFVAPTGGFAGIFAVHSAGRSRILQRDPRGVRALVLVAGCGEFTRRRTFRNSARRGLDHDGAGGRRSRSAGRSYRRRLPPGRKMRSML